MPDEPIDDYLDRLDAELARFDRGRSRPTKPSSGAGCWILAALAVLFLLLLLVCAGGPVHRY